MIGKGTNPSRASMRGIKLDGANLAGATFDNADLRGADLRRVKGLTAEQLRSAIIDSTTQLPDYLVDRPELAPS